MQSYEEQYISILQNIKDHGYYDKNRTGVNTYKLPHQTIQVNLQDEFPILKSKKVAFKTLTKEMLWIMQTQSNNVNDLDSTIWDKWADKDGSIGKTYGYQIKKYHQIDNLIKSLKENPQDRRMMINMWNWDDLPEMNLPPCVFLSMWDVTDGYLNCMVVQRSGDMPVGIPFDTTEYAVLTHLLAQVTGYKPGLLTHVINNAHIYKDQMHGVEEQIKRFKTLKSCYEMNGNLLSESGFIYSDIMASKPKIVLNPTVKNFYDFKIDDILLIDYKHLGGIKMPVSK